MQAIRLRLAVMSVAALLATSACAPRSRTAPEAPPADAGQIVASRDTLAAAQVPDTVRQPVPYEGALGPPRPPMRASPMQRPLEPWVQSALDVLYERPSPRGPAAIPVVEPKALFVTGQGPVIQVLPGPAVFRDRIPTYLQKVLPEAVPYSNNVQRLSRGEIRLVAFDRTLNDSKLSNDSMAVEIAFTDAEGAEWRIEQAMLAPLSTNPIAEPWFGGLAIDTVYHGDTGNGTPAEPKVTCAMCSWGWADIYKNDQRVASSALLHVMVTSDVRDDDNEFAYACYDCTDRPVREVHIIVPPREGLPSAGGFLHVMWENAEIRRGTPEQIAAIAPALAEPVPTIRLAAAPYLMWDRKEIRVKAGQRYLLVVSNEDPSSFHQFRLHPMPSEEGHEHGGESLRHTHAAYAGGIGPLWRPDSAGGHEEGGGEGEHEHGGDTPAPQHVFFPLPQGATWATFVTFEEPGRYEFMCPVGNHYQRGMEGYFIVEADSSGTRDDSDGQSARVGGTP